MTSIPVFSNVEFRDKKTLKLMGDIRHLFRKENEEQVQGKTQG